MPAALSLMTKQQGFTEIFCVSGCVLPAIELYLGITLYSGARWQPGHCEAELHRLIDSSYAFTNLAGEGLSEVRSAALSHESLKKESVSQINVNIINATYTPSGGDTDDLK